MGRKSLSPPMNAFGSAGALFALCLGLSGCSGRPARVAAPDVNPSSAAAEAIALYDKDQSGSLNGEELEACPAIPTNLDVYDVDGSGDVTEEEIANRIQKILDFKVGITSIDAKVTLNGRPLNGVTVHLDPEPFWGDSLAHASGETYESGETSLSADPEKIPENMRRFGGMIPGMYKIRIEDPKGRVPEIYTGDNSPLGKDIALDTVPGRFAIALRSGRR